VRDNGLQVAEVDWIVDATGQSVRPEHGVLVTVLRHMLDHAGGEHAHAPAACFDDAGWVGWRLADVLPLSHAQRQSVLQIDGPHDRLQRLLSLLG
jgi:Lon protease-like protein